MQSHRLPLLLLAIVAAATEDADRDKNEGLVSRLASRATGAVVDIVDPDAVLDHVDVNAVLERVEVDDLLDRVDIDRLLDRVDVDALLARVDVDALLDRVDVDRLIARVDVNAIMDRVDIDRLMARVDVEGIVNRAGIGDVVAESTGALAGSAIDVARRQIVALDSIVGRTLYRLTGRDPSDRPPAPAGLEAATGVDETGRGQVTGHYAGAVSRGLALAVDLLFIWLGFLVIGLAAGFVINLFGEIDPDSLWLAGTGLLVLMSWSFLYFWAALAIAGKTFGMSIFGLRVLTRQGGILSSRQAAVRTLVQPFSFFLFGLGFIGIVTSPERRAMHDAAAGCVVVYDWGDRPAEMPAPITKWIDRHHDLQ